MTLNEVLKKLETNVPTGWSYCAREDYWRFSSGIHKAIKQIYIYPLQTGSRRFNDIIIEAEDWNSVYNQAMSDVENRKRGLMADDKELLYPDKAPF